jgi:DNA repair protein RadD
MDLFQEPNYAGAFPPPREFQEIAQQDMRARFREGNRTQVLCAPTGAGKTYLGLRLCHEALQRGKSAIFVCDRTALIDQTSAAADKYGLTAHGVIQAQHWRYRPHERFQIASAQTLARRKWPHADVIVVDEAHTFYSSTIEHIQETKAAVIGLTATPFAKGMGRVYTGLVCASTMSHLTEVGVLVPMRVMVAKTIDMRGAERKSSGEWTDEEVTTRGVKIVGDIVETWLEHGEGRPTIAFCATIAHCQETVAAFERRGVPARCYTSLTSDDDRREYLREFDTGAVKVLVSVEALAKGFDRPYVSCVIDARPLRKSLSTWVQMVGRGLRSLAGKTDCILLDHSGNAARFADDFSDMFFNGVQSLDTAERLDKVARDLDEDDEKAAEGKACPVCGHRPCGKRCIKCGHIAQQKSTVAALAGKAEQFDLLKRSGAVDHSDLWAQVMTHARGHGNPETARARASHLFREIVGDWPARSLKFSDPPNVPVSRQVINKVTQLRIAFIKGKKAAA